MEDSTDKAIYIKVDGRAWCIWNKADQGLIAIPEDEEAYGNADLIVLRNYLKNEGFFEDYFAEGPGTIGF
jgi:hypothetical protein